MKTVETILDSEIKDGIINGASVLSGKDGRETFALSAGFANPLHTFPMTFDTVIDVASTTKVAACITSLLICHARGLIDFDAPFTEYLKDYSGRLYEPVRVRDLANHTSGFVDVPGEPKRRYFDESGQKMLSAMLTEAPPFPPTRHAYYACWNYILLAMILERITGIKFPEFCRKEIFEPLGMESSSVGEPRKEIPSERLAQTMGTAKPGQISDLVAFRIYRDGGVTGNAGLFTTARDYVKLLKCYLNHGEYALGKRLFGETEFREIAPDVADKSDGYRRFGWIIYDSLLDDGLFGTSLLHSGWSGQTILVNFKKEFYAVVLTTRYGDYKRAKADRFEIIRILYQQV